MNWNASKEDFDWIVLIAQRAEKMAQRQGRVYPYRDALMDLTAVHANGCPLRLEELFGAPPFDFSHDIAGIHDHIDRATGKLSDHFLPRYARG